MERDTYFKLSSLIASITVEVDDNNYKKIKIYLDQITNIIEKEMYNTEKTEQLYLREGDIFNDDSAELIDN